MDEPTRNDPPQGDDITGYPEPASNGRFGSALRIWRWAVPTGLALAVASCAAVYYLAEPQYKSHALLQIADKRPALVFNTGENPRAFAATQIELLRSPFVIGRAIESQGLGRLPDLREIAGKEDAVRWISRRLKVVRIGQSEMYEVSFTTRHPESARLVVEAIVETYLRFQMAETDRQQCFLLEILQEELICSDRNIELKREKVRALAAYAGDGLIETASSDQLAGETRAPQSFGQKLMEMEIELDLARAQVAAATEEANEPIRIPEREIAAMWSRDSGALQLNIDIAVTRKKLEALGPDDPAAGTTRDELAAQQDELENRKQVQHAVYKAAAEEEISRQRREALSRAVGHCRWKENFVLRLKQRIQEQREADATHPDKSLELKFARDELHNAENVRAKISDRIVELQTEARAPSQVSLIARPKVPEFPERPTLHPELTVVGTIAFLAPFLLGIPFSICGARRGRTPEADDSK